MEEEIESVQYRIGRSPECDLVFNNPFVSAEHAVLENYEGVWWVTDQDSTNGTFINGWDEGNRIHQSPVSHGDILYLSKHRRIPFDLLLAQLESGSQPEELTIQSSFRGDKDTIRIGRTPDNDIILQNFQSSRYHALIRALPDGGRELVDLAGKTGTVCNGRHLKKESMLLESGESIEIAGTVISVQFSKGSNSIQASREEAGWFINADGVGKDVHVVNAAEKKTILSDVDLTLHPGEMVGLLGPSGSGKTTLLQILAGVDTDHMGQVLYDNEAGLHLLSESIAALGLQIGYVPQDDVMHAQLTVLETFFHTARQKVPRDVTNHEIYQKVDFLIRELGLENVTKTRIGNVTNKTLSGGQKKRVNIGLELIGDPRVLFLDEPTSGLSSYDTSVVVNLLHKLCTQRRIPVIFTIHQPSLSVYNQLDQVIFLKEGQRLYQGTPDDSVRYFGTHGNSSNVEGPEGIMEALEAMPALESCSAFEDSSEYKETVTARKERLVDGREIITGMPRAANSSNVNLGFLIMREFICKVRDKAAMFTMLLQAPIIALFLGWVFHGDQTDVNTPLFMLSLVGFWFGINSSSGQIVGELPIVLREVRGGLPITAYLLTKFLVLALFTLGQSFLLVGIARPMVGLEGSLFFFTWLCWIVSLSGIGLGLLISAAVRSEVAANSLVPLALIPCILFGGKLKPHAGLEENSQDSAYKIACAMNPIRWGYEANVYIESKGGREVASAASSKREFSKWWKDVPPMFDLCPHKEDIQKQSLWIQGTLPGLVSARNSGILLVFTLCFSVMAWFGIRRKTGYKS